MSLSEFEIAVGGITSIPATSSLILLIYKTLGEKHLGAAKLKSRKVSAKPSPPVSNNDTNTDRKPTSSTAK